MTLWYERLREALDITVVRLGRADITLWGIISLLTLATLLFWMAGVVRRFLVHRVLARTSLELGIREAIGSIVRYVVLLLGTVSILQAAGLDLTALSVFAGAIGIGLGLGLQNITNNFLSGIIILVERPIKVGDRIEIGNVNGDVVDIGARSTRVVTNDNISIIIPNSRLVAENVVNWKHNNDRVRFHLPVGVAYGTSPRLVEQVLLEVARENPDVLEEPGPVVFFRGFGDSSLDFELLVWNTNLIHRRPQLLSDLYHAVYVALEQHGIEIPFPQRVVHHRYPPSDDQAHSA